MSDMKQEPKKKEVAPNTAPPSIANVNDDAKAKQIQEDARARIDAAEAHPDAAAATLAETKGTGKRYMILDSVLEVRVGSIIPNSESVRNKGAAVWSSEFDPPTLEKRYLDAGAIEVWADEPEAKAASR